MNWDAIASETVGPFLPEQGLASSVGLAGGSNHFFKNCTILFSSIIFSHLLPLSYTKGSVQRKCRIVFNPRTLEEQGK